ncbi:MAG: tRNA (adenosine(37)-N6)-threonylcarbamoyltransferase complex ATPase subunit type 1 TsaE [Chitinispirillaceae bacterium]|nr:tRNA (adenosine(37)-N6)-threonylcarbamoyltransferase complex ATPase subunit type 1 TsaE [Chitinispirillaceae bacterium]
MVFKSNSVEETHKIGAIIAHHTKKGDIYVLEGDLGCGKTELVRGFVKSITKEIIVRSPTFSIVNIYETPIYIIYHFDFYRISDPSELDEIGFEEYVSSDNSVSFIEWGTMFPSVLPTGIKLIKFKDLGNSFREISCDFPINP